MEKSPPSRKTKNFRRIESAKKQQSKLVVENIREAQIRKFESQNRTVNLHARSNESPLKEKLAAKIAGSLLRAHFRRLKFFLSKNTLATFMIFIFAGFLQISNRAHANETGRDNVTSASFQLFKCVKQASELYLVTSECNTVFSQVTPFVDSTLANLEKRITPKYCEKFKTTEPKQAFAIEEGVRLCFTENEMQYLIAATAKFSKDRSGPYMQYRDKMDPHLAGSAGLAAISVLWERKIMPRWNSSPRAAKWIQSGLSRGGYVLVRVAGGVTAAFFTGYQFGEGLIEFDKYYFGSAGYQSIANALEPTFRVTYKLLN